MSGVAGSSRTWRVYWIRHVLSACRRALVAAGPKHIDRALAGLDEGLKTLNHPVTLQLYAIELEIDHLRYDSALARLDQIASRSVRKETWLIRRVSSSARRHRGVAGIANQKPRGRAFAGTGHGGHRTAGHRTRRGRTWRRTLATGLRNGPARQVGFAPLVGGLPVVAI